MTHGTGPGATSVFSRRKSLRGAARFCRSNTSDAPVPLTSRSGATITGADGKKYISQTLSTSPGVIPRYRILERDMTTILLTLLLLATVLFCAFLLLGMAMLLGEKPDDEDDNEE